MRTSVVQEGTQVTTVAWVESDVFCEIWGWAVGSNGFFKEFFRVLVTSKVTSALVCHEDETVR